MLHAPLFQEPVPGFDTDLAWRFVGWILSPYGEWINMLFMAGFGLMFLGWLLNSRK